MEDSAEERKKYLLQRSKVFCAAAWSNLMIDPGNNVLPCDSADRKSPVGDLGETRLDHILNSQNLRQIRLNMLNDIENRGCHNCYLKDSRGVSSLRRDFNAKFGRYFQLEATKNDGSVERHEIRHLDITFSFLCNFRCRYCDSSKSTAWFPDEKLWLGEVHGAPVFQRSAQEIKNMLDQLEPYLPHIEQIHFMGGEPLLTEEHCNLLNLLIKKKLFHAELSYNTNFSVMQFKGQDMMELWDRFESVAVLASLDAMGRRGEYIRKGQDWDQVLRNRERMLKVCPRVNFELAPAISVFNALHFPDFYADWVRRGFLSPERVTPGYVLTPYFYCAQILPEHLKARAIERYEECIQKFIRPRGLPEVSEGYARGGGAFRMIQDFLRAQDSSALLPKFAEMNQRLDEIRGESFADVFPELAELYQQ